MSARRGAGRAARAATIRPTKEIPLAHTAYVDERHVAKQYFNRRHRRSKPRNRPRPARRRSLRRPRRLAARAGPARSGSVGCLPATRAAQERLVPLRMARMAASPFAFLRGSATVMAWDLAQTPSIGHTVMIDGDAHVCNFGLFRTPRQDVVFDLQRFRRDPRRAVGVGPEAADGELQRRGARERRRRRTAAIRAVRSASAAYRTTMAELAQPALRPLADSLVRKRSHIDAPDASERGRARDDRKDGRARDEALARDDAREGRRTARQELGASRMILADPTKLDPPNAITSIDGLEAYRQTIAGEWLHDAQSLRRRRCRASRVGRGQRRHARVSRADARPRARRPAFHPGEGRHRRCRRRHPLRGAARRAVSATRAAASCMGSGRAQSSSDGCWLDHDLWGATSTRPPDEEIQARSIPSTGCTARPSTSTRGVSASCSPAPTRATATLRSSPAIAAVPTGSMAAYAAWAERISARGLSMTRAALLSTRSRKAHAAGAAGK